MKLDKKITVITTLDLSQRPIQLILRLIRLKRNIKNNAEVLIIHADRNNLYDKIVKKIFKGDKGFISIEFKGETICNSLLRNIGSKNIKTEYLIFCDIDVFPDLILFNSLYKKAIINGISVAPCLYLNKKGTRKFLKSGNIYKIINSYFMGDTTLIQHLAIPSSVICISIKLFNLLHGFDEKYIGHGYEDFDFLTKIYIYKKFKLNTDFFIDRTYISPLFSIGFRAELGKLCIDNLIEKNIAIHLYHKKRRESIYYKLRAVNAKYYFQKNKNLHLLHKKNNNEYKYPLLFYFFERCNKLNKDISQYSVLFNNNYKNKNF